LHNLHSTAHAHSASTASALAGRRSRSVETTSGSCLLLFTLGVADGLVDRKDGACGFSGSGEHIDSHNLGLPHKLLEEVPDLTLKDVDANPKAIFAFSVMAHAELVKNVGGVHSGVFGELLGDNFESLGKAVHNKLGLARYGADVLAKVAGKLHLDSSSTSDNSVSFDGTGDNHNGVVERTSGFLDVLGGTTTEDEGDGLGVGALGEHVVSFVSELDFLELSTFTKNLFGDTKGSGLALGTSCLTNTVKILKGDATSAEDIAVSEVLGSEITNGKLGEDNLGSSFDNSVEFVVNDLPFGVNNLLEIVGVFETDLSGVLFGLKLKFEVHDEHLGVLKGLGLLLETGVGEGLAEADTFNEEGISNGATSDLFDTNIVLVKVFTEVHDGIDDHFAEEILVAGNNLGVEGSHGALLEQVALLGIRLVSDLDGNFADAVKAEAHGIAVTLDDNGGVHALIDELLRLLQEFTSGQNDGSSSISDFVVLGAGNIDQSLGGGVDDVEETNESGTIVGDGNAAAIVDKFVHSAGTYKNIRD
jgi:hypothetical protein